MVSQDELRRVLVGDLHKEQAAFTEERAKSRDRLRGVEHMFQDILANDHVKGP
jgi:hypothetical protein